MPDVKVREVFLRDANDFSDWYLDLETQAYTGNIWEYVDPDGNCLLEEPTFPVPRDITDITPEIANKLTLYKLLLSEYLSKMTPY